MKEGTFARVWLRKIVHGKTGLITYSVMIKRDGRDDYLSIPSSFVVDNGTWVEIDKFEDLSIMETIGTVRLPDGLDLGGMTVVRAE